jgi:glycosyltransferase involved in cell wall biosynthesis
LIGIVIATYGEGWVTKHRALFERALQSALSQSTPVDVVWEHGPTLAEARNRGARHVKGDRLVFLDADDWLDTDFALRAVEAEDVLQPLSTYFIDSKFSSPPMYIPPHPLGLSDGNHLIVGCPVNREVFMDVGGFDEWPVYEDWALWLKIEEVGGTFGKTTGIYNVAYRPDGRNSSPEGPKTYDLIRSIYK